MIQGNNDLSLPEKYNGLGYRNLISMYFRLIQFREKWLEALKTGKDTTPKIHLVFIEEPEAHLHAQAQQVFIRKALEALNDSELIRTDDSLKTQLVISTHSNHIVNELDIKSLKYFRRVIDPTIHIPVSMVVNLSRVFGDDKETSKFVTRYIRLTHCDIFFADAAILVEGAAERILMPRFLQLEGMSTNYIAIIEINGSHAHRFRSLIEKLGIPTLIITDIDASQESIEEEKTYWKSVITDRGKGYKTNNDSIKKWIIGKENIDELLDLSSEYKVTGNVRLAYQTQISVRWNNVEPGALVYPYTFEDALIFTNLKLFKGDKIKGMGTATTIYNDCKKAANIHVLQEIISNQLEKKQCSKAEFANSLLYEDIFDGLKIPQYISEGLQWLKKNLEIEKENKR